MPVLSNGVQKRPLILVVDDEARVRQVVRKYLEQGGFRVIEAENGHEALAACQTYLPDLIVLDVMLPGVDGFAITEALRSPNHVNPAAATHATVPIILLTARKDEMDRVLGFDLGIDDYVTKPFSPRELVGRVRAVLRRTMIQHNSTIREIEFGEYTLSYNARRVTHPRKDIALTKTEFDVLFLLASHRGTVFTHEQILDVVWDHDPDVKTNVVTSCIYRLRQKIETDVDNPIYLHTVWGVGYVFDPSGT